MLDQDKNYIDPDEEVAEEASVGFDTEDDPPKDEPLPPKDED